MSQPAPPTAAAPSESMYGRTFWLAFVANVLLVMANTLTFRFAEFVKFLGGNEEITGRIVSAGLIGSLIWRAFLGQALDRFGVRRVWLASSLAYLGGCWMILTSTDVGWHVYAARVLFVVGLASMFAASLSHILTLAPPDRRTEMIATFGASGFLGMIGGAQLGDWLFHVFPQGSRLYDTLFGLTMLFGAVHAGLAMVLTAGNDHRRPEVTPAFHQLAMRYWPPLVLVVTLMMGLGFLVTMVFLTRYATELGLGGIRTFFTAYAMTAFLMRLAARQWSRTTGRHQLIVYGLAAHAVGQFALTFVTRDWQFIPAAVCMGFGHSLLFPCVVSFGVGSFPEQYRGTGTTITLAAIDLGTILTAPLLGWIIDHFGFHPMLYGVSACLALASLAYAIMTRRVVDADVSPATLRQDRERPREGPEATAPMENERQPA